MAKKTAAPATIEEKMNEALIPAKEQLYAVPENWCWTRLFFAIKTSKEKTDDFSSNVEKYVGLEHLKSGEGIVGYGNGNEVKSTKNIFHPGQILYGKLRPYLNKHDIAPCDGICSTDILVFKSRDSTIAKYVNYFFDHPRFIEYVIANSKGINLPRVSESVILDALFPLPPLPEQRRIVNCIETMFAKLDEAKEKAQAVIDGYEDRKSAILHKAFAGELTAEWRKINDVSRKDWDKVALSEVCKVNPPKADVKNLPDDYEVSFFPMSALSEIHGAITEHQTRHLSEVRTGFTNFSEGDVVFAKITPCMENGKSAVIGALVNNIGLNCTPENGHWFL